ncbi:MAG TPA: nucleotidyltransferase family protein [Candidatus Binataceae bacterium]|nr:nucleotidyltransferase family protein [Candidatus Binataceae bacterium]
MTSRTNRSGEVSFLLRCCAPKSTRPAAPPGVDFDWSWLEQAARAQGVLPLVARSLATLDDPPHPIRDRIRTSAVAIELRNEYLAARLIELMGEFARNAIALLAFKGPILAQLAYGDPGLRVFADLDILVRKADVPRAAHLLERLGFAGDYFDHVAFQSDFFHAVEINFRAREGDLNLDLHWDLAPGYYPFGPRGDAVWQRASVVPLGERQVPTLAPEDHLLFLAVHASRHGWPLLSQICDVAYFASRVKLDWATLTERASRTGCARMLNLGLMLAAGLLAAELPAGALQGADAETRSSVARLAAQFCSEASPADSTIGSVTRSLVGIEQTGERVRYLLLHALAPTLIDAHYCPLPRWLYPAYYLVRPIRIGLRGTRSLGAAARAHMRRES